MTATNSILATGFVVDSGADGTIFPSAGGNSANPKVQAIYWRCLAVLFASARITNPAQRLILFSNVAPPVVDGADLARVLDRYGVEVRVVSLTARLDRALTPAWGNVLYFFDILANLAAEPLDTRFALVDSDVLVTGPLDPLFGLLDHRDYGGYVVDTQPDHPVNGLSRNQMQAIVSALGGDPSGPPLHYGGEMFLARLSAWARDRHTFLDLLEQASNKSGPAAGVRTEEHIFSIAWPLLGQQPAETSGQIKRIWTSPRFNTALPGDEKLPLWHLPAEKRYGLQDLFRDLARMGWPTAMDSAEFHALARRRCGIPAKGLSKIIQDGVRQVAAKAGLRT